jgi:hypothetical protein
MLNSVVSMTRSAVAKVRVQRHTRVVRCKGRARRRVSLPKRPARCCYRLFLAGVAGPVFSFVQQRFFQ